MRLLLALALVAASTSAASAQHVFGGCPQPAITAFIEPTSKETTCTAAIGEKPESAKTCGVVLGDAKDALEPAADVTSRLAKSRDKRRTAVELRANGRTVARYSGDTVLDCSSQVWVSPDRKTLAVEIIWDKMTLMTESQMYQLVVFHLKKPLPAPKPAKPAKRT
jgi:hypothetical protein